MRIVVYGAGAVGGFFGGLLARSGHRVRFVARGAQLEALHQNGLRISSTVLGELTVPVDVAASASDFGTAELVLLCVKTQQTAEVFPDMEEVVGPDTLILPLQNGIDSDDLLVARFGRSHVVSAVVYVVAAIEKPGVIRHTARGTLMIGTRFDVPAERLETIAEQLTVHGVRIRVEQDIDRQRWYKLMWNASFNGVSALTLKDTQTLLRTRETRGLITEVMREIVAIAQASGVDLTAADVEKSITESDAAPPIRTSMLEDRERGRPMEIEALVGTLVRRGRQAGVPIPATAALYALLKGIDAI